MKVTLYLPGQPPRAIAPAGFELSDQQTGFAGISDRIAQELGCAPGLVDVMDCGPDFAAYTIFDCEGGVNEGGTAALVQWTKHPEAYISTDTDDQLCGPLLLVTRS